MSNYTHEVKEDSKEYFSMIPNIICHLGLDPYQKAVYLEIKRIAGQNGVCFMNLTNMCERLKISESKVREVKKQLSTPFAELGGKPLIKITKRKTAKGGDAPDLITIVDVWVENMNYFSKNYEGGVSGEGGGCATKGGEGVPQTPKEEPILKKNHLKEEHSIQSPTPLKKSVDNPIKNPTLNELNESEKVNSMKRKMKFLGEEFQDTEGKFQVFEINYQEMYARKYSEEIIEGAYTYMVDVYESGNTPKNPLGMFVEAMKKELRGRSPKEKECLIWFLKTQKEMNLRNLQIYETFVLDSQTSKDMSFRDMELDDFKSKFFEIFIKPAQSPEWKGIDELERMVN